MDKSALPARAYRVRIVPWLWFMTKASRCFVYLPEKKDKTIQEVFDEMIKRVKSYGHVETWNDAGNAAILKSRNVEHCIQYRETDFNFLSRTLEQYGVYYYFKHEKDKHTMVLSDKPNYPLCEESEINYPASFGKQVETDRITSWDHSYEFVSGKCEQIDYDFLQPSTSLKVNAQKHGQIPLQNNSGYEMYDNSNDYVKKSDGREESVRRMEEEETRFSVIRGSSTCKSLSAGHAFKLKSHHNCPSEAGKSYVLVSVTHIASQPGRTVGAGGDQSYSNQFVCIPKETQYRAPRLTQQPVLSNIQTAFVVGPSGEEIYTDEHGRVKVQFHWDREGKRDENTCCWVRVSQGHSGQSFGAIDIPRIGEEVIVSFVEGNPDRPIITGRLYNAQSMPPFPLPDQKTRCGIKSKTYKGSGYNEISLDDATGKEQIRIHAERDMDTTIKRNRRTNINANDTLSVGNNQTISIGGNQVLKVKKDRTIEIKGKLTETVTGAVSKTYSDTLTTTVTKKITLKSTSDAIDINAATEIKLSVGSNSITIDTTGITINGMKITSTAVGIHEIKGAMVKINS
jgi:type VI secretion system secreted protein VgrG